MFLIGILGENLTFLLTLHEVEQFLKSNKMIVNIITSLALQHYKQSLHTYIPLQDNSGVIENEELSGFLKDLLELVGYNHVKILVVGEEPQIQRQGQ